jgi:hypothetical protein
MNMTRQIKFAFGALLFAGSLLAQAPTIDFVDANTLGRSSVEVSFSKAMDSNHPEDLQRTEYTLTALPSNKALTVTGVRRLGGTAKRIEITFSGNPSLSDAQIQVKVNADLHFVEGTTASAATPAPQTGTLVKDKATQATAMKALVDEASKAGKSSQEKNIFASGFVTTASHGDTQGGADIHLNTDLSVPGLKAFLNIIKTTADGSDAKNFEAGGTFRNTFLLGKAGRLAIQNALTAYENAPTDANAKKYDDALAKFQKKTLAAFFLDFTGKLEGEATNFNVTNGVFEASLKLQSRVKNLSKQGFFHFQILPAGFEGGKTLRQPDSTTPPMTTADKALQQLDGIARFKTGATLNVFWDNPKQNSPVKRFELESGVVDRYLFLNEIHYDATTKTNSTILKDNKPYFYSDAKLFLVETTAGRFGVKASYQRGSLPPVYADVKSFQFGFLFESAN